MALPANWYFGARNSLAGDQSSPFGAFNLGGIQDSPPVQSSVATPNPAAAGVSGGPTGGMSVGLQDQPMGGAESSPAASPSGPGFSVGEAASVAGRGGSLSLGQTGLPGFTGLSSVSPNAASTINGLVGMAGLPKSMGLTQAQMASLLRLPVGTVKALEAGSLDSITSRKLVRTIMAKPRARSDR